MYIYFVTFPYCSQRHLCVGEMLLHTLTQIHWHACKSNDTVKKFGRRYIDKQCVYCTWFFYTMKFLDDELNVQFSLGFIQENVIKFLYKILKVKKITEKNEKILLYRIS